MGGARVHKRAISDQQRRRELSLERQKQQRRDLQHHARQLASAITDLPEDRQIQTFEELDDAEEGSERDGQVGMLGEEGSSRADGMLDILEGARLRGAEAKLWYAQQFMLPEWMIDIPSHLQKDWYVMARPAGKRCIVISSKGTTVSRMRNGSLLHYFPSMLPNGARVRDVAAPAHVFCILDCIFHESDSTYYILDVMCWRGYSLYDCSAEFRFFWRDSKLLEEKVFMPTCLYHRYRFSVVPVYEATESGLQAAYFGPTSFQRDGMLLYNRHAHYVLGVTPLTLLWKDASCSEFPLDTDSKGQVPTHQQVVLQLQIDGAVVTGDNPPVKVGKLPEQVLSQNARYLKPGRLLRFSIGDEGLCIIDGKPVAADIHYQGPANNSRLYADIYTKILFQYAARHSPLTFMDLLAMVQTPEDDSDTQMAGNDGASL